MSEKESATRNNRTEFIREDELGVVPTAPTIYPYSSTVLNFNWSAGDVTHDPRQGLGRANPHEFVRGPETHEVTVQYELERWFVDDAGDPLDAAYDAIMRTATNAIPNSHTVQHRTTFGAVSAGETVSGNTSRPTRLYTVGTGGYVSEASIVGDPSENQAVTVELTYTFQYVRPYQVDQPDALSGLTVRSTDPADTDLSVTIESDGGTTSESLTTDSADATTVVASSNDYDSIDAVYVPDEHVGDIVVSLNEGDSTAPTEGDALAEIFGSNRYNGVESDSGIVPVDAGTRNTDGIGTPETFIGDSIDKGTDPIAYEVNAMELGVENSVESTERMSGFGMALSVGDQTITATTTEFGQTTAHQSFEDAMTGAAFDIPWQMDGGTLTVTGTVLDEPGERALEEGQAVMTVENGRIGTGITLA